MTPGAGGFKSVGSRRGLVTVEVSSVAESLPTEDVVFVNASVCFLLVVNQSIRAKRPNHDRFVGFEEVADDLKDAGVEPDIFVNWQIKSDVTLALRYGLFFPSLALPEHDVRQFLYGGLTFAF